MILEHIGLKEINGSLVVLDDVDNASMKNGGAASRRRERARGRIVKIDGKRVVIQVFEGTRGVSMVNTRTRLSGHPMELPLSPEILGRVFDGLGRRSTAWARYIPLAAGT